MPPVRCCRGVSEHCTCTSAQCAHRSTNLSLTSAGSKSSSRSNTCLPGHSEARWWAGLALRGRCVRSNDVFHCLPFELPHQAGKQLGDVALDLGFGVLLHQCDEPKSGQSYLHSTAQCLHTRQVLQAVQGVTARQVQSHGLAQASTVSGMNQAFSLRALQWHFLATKQHVHALFLHEELPHSRQDVVDGLARRELSSLRAHRAQNPHSPAALFSYDGGPART